ncbi:hypothetical protein CTT30_20255 [Vibrio coralliilyticus]|uniref:ATP-binding protein n=2 Tax=Vibrionaceae TaxID=641 RepID=UPI0020759E18|nr:ATP-binding protein [Vibrio sp. SCSIO 43145]USD47398.1 response regulator [Vibrio sp. SCSIO 43145]USD98362.1 hypothetical protein CTT30_20255 [Vibrio coralliilyticus]
MIALLFKIARLCRNLVTLLIMILWVMPTQAHELFSQEEKQWIRANPVVWYAYPDSWPVDFEQEGHHVGLSKDYLDIISEISGLTFRAVSDDTANGNSQTVDLISLVSQRFAMEDKHWLLTIPYLNVGALVVSKSDKATVYSLKQLYGKKLGVLKNNRFFSDWLIKHHPQIILVEFEDALHAIEAIKEGDVYAVLDTELTMRPIVQRYAPMSLSITGSLPEAYIGLSMAVDSSKPVLLSILNKSLQALTAEQTEKIFNQWGNTLQLGVPPVKTVLYYYRYEAVTYSILICVLLVAMRQVWISRRRAQASEKSKARFLAVMSHEIRTPLNAVMASLDLLKQCDTPQQEQKYLSLARQSANNLMELLNDILDYSRLESESMTIRKEAIDVGELLKSVCDSHQPSAINKGLVLRLKERTDAEKLFIKSDAQRLRQILHNLVSNAIKFSSSGEILMSWEVVRNNSEPSVVIDVRDEGQGIEKEAQAKVFKAWEQSNSGVSRGGSGLGLYISNQFAQLMGGKLTLHSELGKGTRVSLSLPLELASEQEMYACSVEQSGVQFNDETSVLVVEDHPVNRQLICEQLRSLGCHVESADSGEAALALLEDENYYSMILLDCHLPGYSGYQVAEKIRDREEQLELDHTPIVAISALNEQKHVEKCYASGMDDVLHKPISFENLVPVLNKWCEQAATMATALSSTQLFTQEQCTLVEADLRSLELAFNNGDIKHQLYYAHRLHGVALMSKDAAFIKSAARLESLLREKKPISAQEGAAWCSKLAWQILALSQDKTE